MSPGCEPRLVTTAKKIESLYCLDRFDLAGAGCHIVLEIEPLRNFRALSNSLEMKRKGSLNSETHFPEKLSSRYSPKM